MDTSANTDAPVPRRSGGPQAPSIGRRLAAAGALLALLAAVTIIIVGLLSDPIRLLAAVLMVAGAVLAGATALVRRGAARMAAAAAALLALVALVVLLAAGSVLRLAILVGLVLVSTAATRLALGSDLADGSATARPVGPARRGVLFLNPWSGGGTVGELDLAGEARRRGVTPVVLQRGDDLRRLAERAVADGADVLGMAGGDGSQAIVADVAHRHGLAFVCVPAGTRNHFALDLGLDRAAVVAALDAFGPAIERRLDLAMLGERVFVNNASLGVYATVVQSDDYRDAKLATTAQMLPDLLGPDAQRFDLRFAGPDGEQAAPADVLLISNGPYRLDRLNGFGTRERMDAGTLGVVSLSVNRAVDLPTLLAAELAGRIASFRGYRAWATTEFVVDSAQPLLDVGVDGEALQLAPPLRFRSLPGALRVRTPVDGTGAAPAAAAPAGTGAALTALLRVLRGLPAR